MQGNDTLLYKRAKIQKEKGREKISTRIKRHQYHRQCLYIQIVKRKDTTINKNTSWRTYFNWSFFKRPSAIITSTISLFFYLLIRFFIIIIILFHRGSLSLSISISPIFRYLFVTSATTEEEKIPRGIESESHAREVRQPSNPNTLASTDCLYDAECIYKIFWNTTQSWSISL